MVVTLTGHRPERLAALKPGALEAWLNEQLTTLAPEKCISGMAQGADQLFAALSLANNIPLINAFPYRRHKFHPAEQMLIDNALENKFISEAYSKECYFIRDCWMVDNADIVLVVWDGIPYGGSYITMEYAKKQGKQVILFPFMENMRGA